MSDKLTVNVNLNGTIYSVACEFGEEERLIESSEEVNKAIKELSSVSQNVGETRLLAMTSLLIADKFIETKNALEEKKPQKNLDFNSKDLTELMDWIEKATIRMNNIANLLEKK